MASTTFSSGTTITSTWLNDVDAVVWDVFNGATTVAGATARLNSFVGDSGSGGTKGLVPAPASGDSTKYLRGDGTWTAIAAGGDFLADGTVSMTGNLTLGGAGTGIIFEGTTADAFETTLVAGEPTADRTVTLPDATGTLFINNVSATDRILGRDTAGAGAIEELTASAVLDMVGSAAQGDILYRGASGWAFLAAGTSGYFLKTQGAGANPTWAVGGSSTITLGTPQNTTSGTSIDFTSIPTGTKMIIISGTGISTNGTSIPIIQIGDSGGVETTSYVGGVFTATTGAAGVFATATNGINLTSTTAAGDSLNFQCILSLQSSTTNTWRMSGSGSIAGSIYFYACGKALSAELDRVRLTTAGGANTFDAGEINIIYLG